MAGECQVQLYAAVLKIENQVEGHFKVQEAAIYMIPKYMVVCSFYVKSFSVYFTMSVCHQNLQLPGHPQTQLSQLP
jgi:hypothetical protein